MWVSRMEDGEVGKKEEVEMRVKLWEFAFAEKATSFCDGFRVGWRSTVAESLYTVRMDLYRDLGMKFMVFVRYVCVDELPQPDVEGIAQGWSQDHNLGLGKIPTGQIADQPVPRKELKEALMWSN